MFQVSLRLLIIEKIDTQAWWYAPVIPSPGTFEARRSRIQGHFWLYNQLHETLFQNKCKNKQMFLVYVPPGVKGRESSVVKKTEAFAFNR